MNSEAICQCMAPMNIKRPGGEGTGWSSVICQSRGKEGASGKSATAMRLIGFKV